MSRLVARQRAIEVVVVVVSVPLLASVVFRKAVLGLGIVVGALLVAGVAAAVTSGARPRRNDDPSGNGSS